MSFSEKNRADVVMIDANAIAAAFDQLVHAISVRHASTPNLAVVGIANGGITIAKRLRERLNALRDEPVGEGIIDIAFYRDDLGHNPIPKVCEPTAFDFDVEGACVLLCDDVLFSGRTVRAALNDLFDQGRPALVELAVLCDRGGRRLPLQSDYTGLRLDAAADEKVQVFLDPLDAQKDRITLHRK